MIEVSLRLGKKEDLPFVYNSWLKSFSENNRDFRRMGQPTYFSEYKKALTEIFNKAAIIIACNPDDHSQIYGYAVSDLDLGILHYLYVKYTFRKMGVARKLLKNIHPMLGEDELICTFANKHFDILRTKYKLTYNPFLR